MKTSLTPEATHKARAALHEANQRFAAEYPGATGDRQPVHTVYGGAQIFSAQTARKIGETALRALMDYAPTPRELAESLSASYAGHEGLWDKIHARVVHKLETEPVEDFRIDFEDGYGNRPEAEEDSHAQSTAREVALGMQQKSLPPFIGLRVKPLNDENQHRSMRTLDLFLTTLLSETGGKIPPRFVVTLPKITIVEQSRTLARLLEIIEAKNGLAPKTLKFELMVETPQSILDQNGRCPLREFVEAGGGRCVAAHFGTYDYTAGCGITAAYQTMDNPVCDFAKHMLQVALAGTPIMLSDGATNIMPVGPHRAPPGTSLTPEQQQDNRDVVHRAWRLSYRHIRHSLRTGYYQGWDLHPAQLPVRYAAMYVFFLEGLTAASQRLKAFMEKAAKATLLGDVFDDAATGQGLLNFFLRGLSCGAVTQAEVDATGLTLAEIQTRSFLKILQSRSKR